MQETQEGTGHAVRVAVRRSRQAGTTSGTIVVMAGDTPLMQGETLAGLVQDHDASARAVTILTGEVPDPFGYGRIVRDGDGDVTAIVEEKDADDDERAIREINSGIFAFDGDFLADALGRITNDNAKGEYYLTDVVSVAVSRRPPGGCPPDRRRAADRGRQRPAPSWPRSPRRSTAAPSTAGCARASPSSTRTPPGSTSTSRSSQT